MSLSRRNNLLILVIVKNTFNNKLCNFSLTENYVRLTQVSALNIEKSASEMHINQLFAIIMTQADKW